MKRIAKNILDVGMENIADTSLVNRFIDNEIEY